MSNFPPFRAAPPKGEKRPAPESVDDALKPLAEELDKLLSPANKETLVRAEDTLDDLPADVQHVEHVRCCAKCFSTEVVDAVKIGDAIYIKVS